MLQMVEESYDPTSVAFLAVFDIYIYQRDLNINILIIQIKKKGG